MLGVMSTARAHRAEDRAERRFFRAMFRTGDKESAQRWDLLYDAFEARWQELAPYVRCEDPLCARTGLPMSCCECWQYGGQPLPRNFYKESTHAYGLHWDETEQVWYRMVL